VRRLTPAFLTVVMFGVIGLLVLGYFAKNLFAQKEKPVANTLREIPMAVADIKPGTVITESHLGMGRHDRNKLTPDVLLVNRVIVGRVAREPIKAATPIRASNLYNPGELPPLDIGPGMRAVSIEVGDGVAMVDGIIKPGDKVDVLFTAQASGNDNTYQGGMTMRLFEAVKVLAINRNFAQGRVDRGNNHVTLELTGAQTNIVVLAKDRGKITLTYNPTGTGNGGLALSNAERVTLYEMLGLQKADPMKEPFTTEIYRGSTRIANSYDSKGRYVTRDPQGQNRNDANPQYQLPNSPNSNGGSSNTAPTVPTAPANGVPPLNAVPNHAAFQSVPQLVLPRSSPNAPTAQLLQPRN